MRPRILLTLGLSLSLIILPGLSSTSFALTFQDVIVFPLGTQAKDTSSGNNVDLIYHHSLARLTFETVILDSAALELTHQGNTNEGPQTEIWSILVNEITLGTLSESLRTPKLDLWSFPPEILERIVSLETPFLPIALSELTPFNNEKIDLIQSQLKIQYHKMPPQMRALPTPEINSLWSLGSGLVALFRRKKSCRKLRQL